MADEKNVNDDSEYEDICYICSRPESVAGKMIHIPNNICISNDCMQKTFDSMDKMGPMPGMPGMPYMDMFSMGQPTQDGGVPKNQRLKKKKPAQDKKKKTEEKGIFDIKDAINLVADRLAISRHTVYLYIRQIKQEQE